MARRCWVPPSFQPFQPTNRTVLPGTAVILVFFGHWCGHPDLSMAFETAFDISWCERTRLTRWVSAPDHEMLGLYSARAANSAGAAITTNSLLALQAGPADCFISRWAGRPRPAARRVSPWGAIGSAPLSYQWWEGCGIAARVRFSRPLTLTKCPRPPNLGNYFVVITNSFGSTTSATGGSTTQRCRRKIVSQPTQSVLSIIGQNCFLFKLSASRAVPRFYFQWLLNGTPAFPARPGTNLVFTKRPTGPRARKPTACLVSKRRRQPRFSSNATLVVIVPPTVTIEATDPKRGRAGFESGAVFTGPRANGKQQTSRSPVGFNIGGGAFERDGLPTDPRPGPRFHPARTWRRSPLCRWMIQRLNPTNWVTLTLLAAPEYLIGSPEHTPR